MPFTPRQRPFPGRWRPFLAALALGLLLGFAGPFGSYPAYPTATRYAFWLGLTAAGMALALAADALLPVGRLRPSRALRIAAVALASALPMTFIAAWAMSVVQPGRVFAPQQLPLLFACVAAVQLLVAYAAIAAAPTPGEGPGGRAPALAEPGDETEAAAFPPALLRRLPAEIGSDLLALETEDHYLRVHAAGGSALILMRMADAVALLDPRLGAQVHRRWWVAEAAVAGLRTEGQKLFLRLRDDRLVPVGRTFAATARARFADVPRIGAPARASASGA